MTANTAPLLVFETRVQPDWVDYNGHMRDAYFGLVFSYAVDALMDEIGLDEAQRAATGGTLYVVEAHQYYLAEAHGGDALEVRARILEADAKRFLLHLEMRKAGGADLLSVQESLLLHVDQSAGPKVAPFPEAIRARIEALRTEQAVLAPIEHRARALALRPR